MISRFLSNKVFSKRLFNSPSQIHLKSNTFFLNKNFHSSKYINGKTKPQIAPVKEELEFSKFFSSSELDNDPDRINPASPKYRVNLIPEQEVKSKNQEQSGAQISLEERLKKIDSSPQLSDLNEYLQQRYNRQMELETKAFDKAVEEYRTIQHEVIKLKKGASLGGAKRMLLSWYTPLREALSKEQKDLLAGKFSKTGYNIFGKFLLLLTPDKLTVITMHVVLSNLLAQGEGVHLTELALTLGHSIQAEINLMRLKEEDPPVYRHVMKSSGSLNVQKINIRSMFLDYSKWPQSVLAHIGSELIRNLLETAYVELQSGEKVKAFSHIHRIEKNKKRGYIVANEFVYRIMEADIESSRIIRETSDVRMFPMIIPPKPWINPVGGGYLTRDSHLMRMKEYRSQGDALNNVNLHEVYKALNVLGSTPWRLNKEIYKVVLTVWETGGGIADLPSRKDFPYPPEPESLEEKVSWIRLMKKLEQKNRDLHSLRCDMNLKLGVANDFMNDPMYFPHNLDFRGRAYPIPPHLNHLGADICRGLLLFFEAKPIGKNGLNWIKIHTANVFGKNKLSFEDRIKFVDSQMDNIIDSANNPLGGKRWWLQAENPWQTLAACFEINNILKSPNPSEYLSHLPVHQDGTCNGLQHYAALGGDVLGGEQVNLLPSDKPQDVYSGVAEMVSKLIDEKAARGDQMAIQLKGKVTRPIIKQTVMTSVYGVTYVGARLQIQSAMKDRDVFQQDEELQYQASSYVAKLTFDALKQMFLGARLIMDWLTTCAKLIAKSGEPVSWVTPLNLPVVQPYRITTGNKEYVKTVLQTMCLVRQSALPVHTSRQQSAFPPNYIHSLDSTHMMKTALTCNEKGITYASVHDSYWTHACTVDEMNAILREAFIWLHEKPLLEDLLHHFKVNHPSIQFPPVPKKGDLDLKKVAESKYFFN